MLQGDSYGLGLNKFKFLRDLKPDQWNYDDGIIEWKNFKCKKGTGFN